MSRCRRLHDSERRSGCAERQHSRFVKWQDRQRLMRFLIDGMLGKLNRWMRILGYETEYAKDKGDDELVNSARRSSSILLTSDEELYRTAVTHGVDSFLIRGKNETERLAALAHRYNLRLSIDPNLSKCPLCGSSIKEVSKAD